MIFGIGVDIIEVDRVKNAIDKYGEKFLGKVFTDEEIEYCTEFKEQKYQHFAARFAAKEAFSKAFGTGINSEFKLHDFAIKNLPGGRPVALLSDELQNKLPNCLVAVSLSHLEKFAVAYIIIEQKDSVR